MAMIHEHWLIYTHEDYSLMMTLSVGIDDYKNLVIKFDHNDSDEPEDDYVDYYRVNYGSSRYLARRCGLKQASQLPAYLMNRFGDEKSAGTAEYSEVRDTLGEILDFLDENGVKYTCDKGRRFTLISSDSNDERQADIMVKYDDSQNLSIDCQYCDSSSKYDDITSTVVITKENCYKLAKQLKASVCQLPWLLNRKFGRRRRDNSGAELWQVFETWRSILHFLGIQGVAYTTTKSLSRL